MEVYILNVSRGHFGHALLHGQLAVQIEITDDRSRKEVDG